MKPSISVVCLGLLAGGAWAIQPPDMVKPIPPQPIEGSPAGEKKEVKPKDDAAAMPDRIERVAVERAFLGVSGAELPNLLREHLRIEKDRGLVIRTVAPEGPAAGAGLVENDILLQVGGKPVASQEQLRGALAGRKPGDKLEIERIHRGERGTVEVTLGKAPDDAQAALREDAGNPGALDELLLDGMSPEQAGRIREAIERNLRAMEDLQRGPAGGQRDMALDLHEHMRRMMQDARGGSIGGGLRFGPLGLSGDVRSSGTVRILDERGSVELKSTDGDKHVKVYDPAGELVWEGPYNSKEDKEAMPAEVRERVEKLNLDFGFKGKGLRFQLGR